MFAYLDPGSGALIWQFLLSALGGILLLLWQVREKAKSIFQWIGRRFHKGRS